MDNLFDILSFPFMQRALLGGFLVSILTSWVGILVVLRRASFFGDAIAHSSLTGVALGLLLGINPLLAACVYAITISFVLPYLKKHSQLPLDSLLGFILPFSMAIGVVLLSLIPGYQPELISFLFGSILSISWVDIQIVMFLMLAALTITAIIKKRLILASFDEEYARISKVNVEKMQIIYDVLLAITIVAGIRFVGIILVNALLVIPPSTVRLFAGSLKEMFIFTPIVAAVSVLGGLIISFYLNIPSGPAVAIVSGTVFILGVFFKKIILK